MSEEKYKKMWDNMLKKLNETERYYLAIVNNQKNQEIERLNNIINRLEKYLIEMSDRSWDDNGAYDDALDKLKSLKEDNNNV